MLDGKMASSLIVGVDNQHMHFQLITKIIFLLNRENGGTDACISLSPVKQDVQ